MKIFPAIDIYNKKAVRLYKGDYAQMTVYAENPVSVALDFKNAGAKNVHVVDLEGAKSGNTDNLSVIENIVKEVYGYNAYKLSNMYLETTEGTLSEEEIASGATNWKLIVKGDFEAAYSGRPGKSTLSIYITEEEFLNISASSDKGVLYRESMNGMKKSAVDAVMPVFERKREQLKP